jgi:hypothetical protein
MVSIRPAGGRRAGSLPPYIALLLERIECFSAPLRVLDADASPLDAVLRESAARSDRGHQAMKDLVYVAITVVFFLLSWLYVRACERV